MIKLEKAKEILGDTAKGMSDEQVTKTVDTLYQFANLIIDSYSEMSPEQRKDFVKRADEAKPQPKQKP